MRFCKSCLYPENAKPTIFFDEEGICSGCRFHQNKSSKDSPIDWKKRYSLFKDIVLDMKQRAKSSGSPHDCLIPVSGGKDSHFQVFQLKKLGLNPLLLSFNHSYNSPAGNANLRNIVEKSGFDHIRYSIGRSTASKLSRLMLEQNGDLTWHYHAGILSLPSMVAYKMKIPYVIWGDQGFAELTGVLNPDDIIEFTNWSRVEHAMRGLYKEDLYKMGLTDSDIWLFDYPTAKQIADIDLKGIYLSNFLRWDAKEQTEIMIKNNGFNPVTYDRERTFNLHAKIEDHAQEVHDYLKFLKFGYGRGTDDATTEIRYGRLKRNEAIDLAIKYDRKTPSSLKYYCELMDISLNKFYEIIEPMRDLEAWQKKASGQWELISRLEDSRNESIKLFTLNSNDHIFASKNSSLYFNPKNKPSKRLSNEFNIYSPVPLAI